MKITLGIDNGSTGSVGILTEGRPPQFFPTPTQEYLHYGKKGQISQRLDRAKLVSILRELAPDWPDWEALRNHIRVVIERPFSGKFVNAVVPAHRFFEATIIVMEDLGLGYEVIDSAVWQKPTLGVGVSGSAALKKASRLRGIQMYPQLTDAIKKHGDADGLLIAHHFHYHNRPSLPQIH